MTDLPNSWQRVWSGLGARAGGQRLYGELVSRYSEPQRKYHSLQHLGECISWFEVVADLAVHPAEVEAALWFHDAIYEVKQHDNEERSASWARAALLEAGVQAASAFRVEGLVLATKHTALPASADEQLLVDIDLSILGATEARFAEYEQQIREEYLFVPELIFRQKRRAILRAFLDRECIYSTEFFRAALEGRARANLVRAVAENGAEPSTKTSD
jgi:predicted metal-dependent HD superfamily phosphohydrolase